MTFDQWKETDEAKALRDTQLRRYDEVMCFWAVGEGDNCPNVATHFERDDDAGKLRPTCDSCRGAAQQAQPVSDTQDDARIAEVIALVEEYGERETPTTLMEWRTLACRATTLLRSHSRAQDDALCANDRCRHEKRCHAKGGCSEDSNREPQFPCPCQAFEAR